MSPKSSVVGYHLFQSLVAISVVGLAEYSANTAIPFSQFEILSLVLIGAFSIAAALSVWRPQTFTTASLWLVAVACCIPTFSRLKISIESGENWIYAAAFVAAAGLSMVAASIYGDADNQPQMVRPAKMNLIQSVAWTWFQTMIFWSVFLWVMPMAILELESFFGLGRFSLSWQVVLGWAGLSLASALGIWSGTTMAIVGHGTPLPTATARRLVIRGPYRFVRNPMAVAGIAQGVFVGVLLGSLSVIGYALSGAIVWHLFVRPHEEADLKDRFGEQYFDYQNKTMLWIPTFRIR